MNSHPNYVGYDAIEGKPASRPSASVRPAIEPNTRSLKAKDLPSHCPPVWLKALEDMRQICAQRGYDFAISPHQYQVARISGDGWRLVIWNAKRGKNYRKMKFAWEGPEGPMEAEDLMARLAGMAP